MRPETPLPEARIVRFHSCLSLRTGSLCLALLLCLGSISCGGTSCFQFISNPGGTISFSNPCPANMANGTVAIRAAAAPAPQGLPAVTDLQHVFVSIRRIEAQPSTSSADDSPDWQDLAPTLRRAPQQVDLLAPKAQACMRSPISLAAVPAGNYRQVRISLVADPPLEGDPVPANNRCGVVGLHCVITANGDVRPLLWNGASDNLQFVSAEVADVTQDDFRVLPDTQTTLTLSFSPFAAMRIPSTAAFRLAPVFTASSAASCESN